MDEDRSGDPDSVDVVAETSIRPTDILVEAEAGVVKMTLSTAEGDEDATILFSPFHARELGSMLHRKGCQADSL